MIPGARRLGAALLASLGIPVPAQEPAQEKAPPVFAREVEQVTVDVVVVDKQGNPVPGLRKEDFSVTDEGQAQTIVSFDVIQRPGLERGPLDAAPGSRPRLVTNASGAAEQGRLFALVFDNLHLSPLNAQRAKAAVAAFLDKGVREGDRVSLIATGGGAWWTTRMPEGRSDLLAILRNLDGRRFPESATDRMTDYEAVRISVYQDTLVANRVMDRWQRYGSTTRQGMQDTRLRQQGSAVPGAIDLYVESRASEAYLKLKSRMGVTLAALERALLPLARSRDRKAVILVSEGFVNDVSQEGFKQVTEAARRANASLYFVDTRGLEAGLAGYSAQFGAPLEERDLMAAVADVSQEGEGSAALALDTGGFSVRNTNDFAAGVVRIGRESSGYYLIGFNPGDIPHDGRFRKIAVRVQGKGLTVRARRGYYAPAEGAKAPSAKPGTGDSDLQRALDAPGFLDGIPLRMTAYVLEETSLGKARVLAAADADVARLAFEEVQGKSVATLDTLMVVAHRDSGEFQRSDQQVSLQRRPGSAPRGPSWYTMVREFDLAPGGYQARLVVRDPAIFSGGWTAPSSAAASRRGSSPRRSAPWLACSRFPSNGRARETTSWSSASRTRLPAGAARSSSRSDSTEPHFFLRAASSRLAVSRFRGSWPVIETYFSSWATASGTRFSPTAIVPRWKYGSGLAGSTVCSFRNASAASAERPALRQVMPSANRNFASSGKEGAACISPATASGERPSNSRIAARATKASLRVGCSSVTRRYSASADFQSFRTW